MANSQGVLKEPIWRDKDFRALPRTAQATYAQLLTQKDLDRAGVQPLMVSKWVNGCDEITEADFWDDLRVLQERRFIFFDTDSHEVFVRSYMRACEVVRYPNILKNALRCAGMVASDRIRHELAKELRRLGRAEATRVADEIDPAGFENGSETLREPFDQGSETVTEGLKGSETPTEPPGTGTGTGKGSFSSLVTSREGELGGNSVEPNTPPNPHCPNHPGGTPDPCGPCAGARKAWVAWNLEHDRRGAAEATERAERKRQAKLQAAEDRSRAIAACSLGCAELDGYLDDGQGGRALCDHRVPNASRPSLREQFEAHKRLAEPDAPELRAPVPFPHTSPVSDIHAATPTDPPKDPHA